MATESKRDDVGIVISKDGFSRTSSLESVFQNRNKMDTDVAADLSQQGFVAFNYKKQTGIQKSPRIFMKGKKVALCDVITKAKINNCSIAKLNGSFGVIARMDIPAGTALDIYRGLETEKQYAVSKFDATFGYTFFIKQYDANNVEIGCVINPRRGVRPFDQTIVYINDCRAKFLSLIHI